MPRTAAALPCQWPCAFPVAPLSHPCKPLSGDGGAAPGISLMSFGGDLRAMPIATLAERSHETTMISKYVSTTSLIRGVAVACRALTISAYPPITLTPPPPPPHLPHPPPARAHAQPVYILTHAPRSTCKQRRAGNGGVGSGRELIDLYGALAAKAHDCELVPQDVQPTPLRWPYTALQVDEL